MLLEFNLFIFGACKWDIVPLKFQICVKRIPLANNEILNFASEEIKILIVTWYILFVNTPLWKSIGKVILRILMDICI